MQSNYLKTIQTVWTIYSVAGVVVILAAFFIPGGIILQNTPLCYSIKKFGKQCFMCGSTRSFIQMGNGNFTQALALNKFAFALYILIIINTVFFISFLFKLKRKNK